jgi:hypothetical protein
MFKRFPFLKIHKEKEFPFGNAAQARRYIERQSNGITLYPIAARLPVSSRKREWILG